MSYNASHEGLFVISSQEFHIGEEMFISVREIKDQSPISCIVKWCLPWGKSIEHPAGFGVEVQTMSSSQREDYVKLIENRRIIINKTRKN